MDPVTDQVTDTPEKVMNMGARRKTLPKTSYDQPRTQESSPPASPAPAAPKGWDESVWGLGKLFLSAGKYLGAQYLPSEFSTAGALHAIYYRDQFMEKDGWMWLAGRTVVTFWLDEADEDMGPWLEQYERMFPALLDSITVRKAMVEQIKEKQRIYSNALDNGWYHLEVRPGHVRKSMVVDEQDYLAFMAGDTSKAPREGK